MINKIKTTMRNLSKKIDKRLKKFNVIYQRLIYGPLVHGFTNSLRKLIVKLMKKNRAKAKITRREKIHHIFNGCKYSLFRHVAVMSYKSLFDND